MIYGDSESLSRYSALVPSLDRIDKILFSYAQEMDSFECDEKLCTLFIALEDGGHVACGWRENGMSNDILGAVTLSKGDFALFLPGERFAFTGQARVRRYSLE